MQQVQDASHSGFAALQIGHRSPEPATYSSGKGQGRKGHSFPEKEMQEGSPVSIDPWLDMGSKSGTASRSGWRTTARTQEHSSMESKFSDPAGVQAMGTKAGANADKLPC